MDSEKRVAKVTFLSSDEKDKYIHKVSLRSQGRELKRGVMFGDSKVCF